MISPLSVMQGTRGYHPMDIRWLAARMQSSHLPYMGFIFEGEVDLRVGITTEQAKAVTNRRTYQGEDLQCCLVQLLAPSVIVIPPGVPYSDGSQVHWERNYALEIPYSVFWIRVMSSGVVCHLSRSHGSKLLSEHSLTIEDPYIPKLLEVFYDELKMQPDNFNAIAQPLFTTVLLRIQRRLRLDPPVIANTVKYPSPAKNLLISPTAESAHNDVMPSHYLVIFDAVNEYIRTHMQKKLTVTDLACYSQLSPTHLNRLFHAVGGTSLMQHVARQRIDSACAMLIETTLPVQEVAHLCGFAHASHLCRTFSKLVGMSPLAWRRQGALRNYRPRGTVQDTEG
jgi:AraC-like DNA-binding protein